MEKHFYYRTRKKGAVYMLIVFVITITTVAIAVGFTTPNIREHKNALRDNLSNNAYLLAEAGNEDVLYRLKNGMNVSAEIVITLNNTTATTTVTDVGSTKEIVTNSEIDSHTRKSKLTVSAAGGMLAGLDYAAHVGTWGIEMDNNAEVRGVLPAVGDIYANGSVRGSGSNVTVTGNIFSSTNMVQDGTAVSESCVQDQVVGQTNPIVDHAQSFVAPAGTDAISKVEMQIKKSGNPASKTIRLVADNGGVPDTTTITSGTLDRNKVTSTYSWVSTTFNTAANLTAGNTYWIVFDTDRHNSRYYYWCKDTSNPYAGGSAMSTQDWSSPSWAAVAGDLTFRIYFGEGESLIDGVDDLRGDAHADTIGNSIIDGDAYYQTISGSSVSGASYPGSLTPSYLELPLTDTQINAWIAEAEAGGTISGNCPGTAGCADDMGPIKIDGNLLEENSETLNVTGTIYITGNMETDNNVVVSCDPAYGAESCVIITDGYMSFRNNSDFQGSGTAGSFILLVTLKEDCLITTGSGCGPSNSGLHHSNNASTGGIFFAQESVAYLENNTSVSSVVARGAKLSNNSALIYDQDLQNIDTGSGPGGGGGGWLVDDWREVE